MNRQEIKNKVMLKLQQNKKSIILGVLLAAGAAVANVQIRKYANKMYNDGYAAAKEISDKLSYENMKEDIIDKYLADTYSKIRNGCKITMYDDFGKVAGHVVGIDQQLDYVNHCIDKVPEIKAHIMTKLGNPAAEAVRDF